MVARFQTLLSVVSFSWTDPIEAPSPELQRHATKTYEKMKALVLKRYGRLEAGGDFDEEVRVVWPDGIVHWGCCTHP
jgi:hypothetical protein